MPPSSPRPLPTYPVTARERRQLEIHQPLRVARSLPVIGVDPSATSLGVVVLDSQLDVLHADTICPVTEGPERLVELYEGLEQVASLYGPFAVAVRESYAVGATNRPYLLGEVGGITQLVLYRHSVGLHDCAPTALKKFVTGTGSASKAEMMLSLGAASRGWFDTESDDVADAYGLARIAACLAGYARTTERPALEVLSVIQGEEPATEASKKPKARKKRAPHMPNLSKIELGLED